VAISKVSMKDCLYYSGGILSKTCYIGFDTPPSRAVLKYQPGIFVKFIAGCLIYQLGNSRRMGSPVALRVVRLRCSDGHAAREKASAALSL